MKPKQSFADSRTQTEALNVRHPREYYPECPDAMLVSLAQQKDSDAFEQLVVRFQSSIRSMLRRMCSDPVLADDLAQQAFLRAFIKISSLKNEKAFAGWLKRLSVNIWLQHCRKNDLLRDAESDTDFEIKISDTSLGMDLDAALEALSTPERLCVVLSYQEGMSHQEITETIQMPLGTVKSHIKRGGEKLNQKLNAYQQKDSEV